MSGGLHGVGSSVVNALSEWLEVEVCNGEHIYRQRYARGVPQDELKEGGDTKRTGTTINFKPDALIFDENDFEYDTLLTRLREQAFLNKGIRITFKDLRGEEEVSNVLHYED